MTDEVLDEIDDALAHINRLVQPIEGVSEYKMQQALDWAKKWDDAE